MQKIVSVSSKNHTFKGLSDQINETIHEYLLAVKSNMQFQKIFFSGLSSADFRCILLYSVWIEFSHSKLLISEWRQERRDSLSINIQCYLQMQYQHKSTEKEVKVSNI